MMRLNRYALALFCLALGMAQAAPGRALDWSGYLQAENRLAMTSPYASAWHEYRLDLRAEDNSSEHTRFFGELWVRSLGYPTAGSAADLSVRSAVAPQDVDLREAYLDVRGLLTDGLRLKLGRQRIAWGRGDKINPTDNINPNDLEDLWDYGRHLGSDALVLSYAMGETTLTAVWVPFFTPAVLPAGAWRQALMPDQALPEALAQTPVTDRVLLPPADLSSGSSAAVKLSGNLAGYDLSLSYLYGRDDLPLVKTVHIASGLTGFTGVTADLVYPRRHIIGLDAAGAIGDVGCWAEAAVIFPEAVMLAFDPDPATRMLMAAYSFSFPEQAALEAKPYVRYLLGADYTFPGGVYVNVQYLHGFVHERSGGALGNFVFMNLDWDAVPDVLKLTPVGGGLEIRDVERFWDHYSFVAMPQAEYKPFDNVSLLLGARWIWGAPGTIFGQAADLDEVFLKAKYSF
ncbi:MAG: DUF1302 family protein [candidate division FCPU426 bacterium]